MNLTSISYLQILKCIISVISEDTPFGELKLGEIGAWLGRRDKNPKAAIGAVSRAWWRYQHKYIFPKRTGIAPFFQMVFGGMVFFYWLNYDRIKHHKNYKYH